MGCIQSSLPTQNYSRAAKLPTLKNGRPQDVCSLMYKVNLEGGGGVPPKKGTPPRGMPPMVKKLPGGGGGGTPRKIG